MWCKGEFNDFAVPNQILILISCHKFEKNACKNDNNLNFCGCAILKKLVLNGGIYRVFYALFSQRKKSI